jgi:hypothetical protein
MTARDAADAGLHQVPAARAYGHDDGGNLVQVLKPTRRRRLRRQTSHRSGGRA